MKSLKPRHALFVAAVAVVLGTLAFACGSNDGSGPGACEGPSCGEGGANEGSSPDGPLGPDTAPTDASDARGDTDAGLDAHVDADADAAITYTGNHIWSKLFGSNASSSVSGAGVAADSAGNVFVTGTLTGDADFGGGVLTGVGGDVFIAKFTKDGNHLWSKKFGDTDVQSAGQIALDAAGSVFVGGNFNGVIDFGGGSLTSAGGFDIFVAKFDANGSHVWSKSFGDPTYQSIGGLALAGSDIVLIGEKSGSVDFGGGALTGRNYLVKLAGANGTHVWSQQSTSGAGFVPKALTVDSTGNIVGAGQLGSTLDWGGGVLTTAGGDDVLVIRFDATGNTLWSKRFGDDQFQDARAVVTSATGDIFLTGRLSGTLDFGIGAMTFPTGGTAYVAKLDKTGAALWSKSYPVTAGGLASSTLLAIDVFGNIAVSGNTHDAIDFGGGPLPCNTSTTNLFVAKLDTTGKHVWSKGWATGGGGTAGPGDVNFDATGNLLFTAGIHQTTIDMGGGPLASIGAGNFLVLAKFAP